MDKDGMPTPDNVFGQEDPLRIPVNVISHSG
jgi:hypothetical protein